MPFKIQRVPQGLLNLLSIFGGTTPIELEDRIRGTIDLTQFYGNQQRRLAIGSNGAVAQGATLQAGVTGDWTVLFSANCEVTRTGTMTALGVGLFVSGPNATGVALAAQEFQRFGATVLGKARLAWVAPYPMILPPQTTLLMVLDSLGTDATAACSVSFDIARVGG